jgi:hypothetical protein
MNLENPSMFPDCSFTFDDSYGFSCHNFVSMQKSNGAVVLHPLCLDLGITETDLMWASLSVAWNKPEAYSNMRARHSSTKEGQPASSLYNIYS